MKFNKNEYFILNILKRALFCPTLSICYPKQVNWLSVFNEAKQHTVLPIVLQELSEKPELFDIDTKLLERWKNAVTYQISINYKLMHNQNEAIALFEKAGLSYAVLKGTSVSVCYPNPELRVLGDIDILFKPRECMRAVELLCANGYSAQALNLTIHEVVERSGVRIEPHYMVAEIPDTPAGKVVSSFLENATDAAVTEEIPPYSFKVLSTPHQAVALLLHMERHMLHDGIGLRQLCDWAVFVNKKTDNDYWEKHIQPVLRQCGLLRFAQSLTKICVLYLGLKQDKCTWCVETEKKICDELMESILRSGNMGRKEEDSVTVKKLSGVSGKDGSGSTITGNFAIKMNAMAKRDFPVCERAPLFLPFIWLYIPVRHLFRVLTGKRKKQFGIKTFNNAKKQRRLYEDLGLYKIK